MLGLLGGDIAGFPNGRRVSDDIVNIELRAIAGATIPLVDPDASRPMPRSAPSTRASRPNVSDRYIPTFPYLGTPKDGFHTPAT